MVDAKSPEALTEDTLVLAVREVLTRSLLALDGIPAGHQELMEGALGKMLRTRLASAFLGARGPEWPVGLEQACAALELIHTASLFHDDVVDGASLRRGRPTLWRLFSPNTAILFGDVILCEALTIIANSAAAPLMPRFLDKVREVCGAETEQELGLRGKPCGFETCERIARSKTGPLFAFAGTVCGGNDSALSAALVEAGYRIGTAYQLADDLLDETGTETETGKTLGTDRLRRKFTLAQDGPDAAAILRRHILDLCETSLRLLAPWPDRRDGVVQYLNRYFIPACFQNPADQVTVEAGTAGFVAAGNPAAR